MAKKQSKTGANTKAPVKNPYSQILPTGKKVKLKASDVKLTNTKADTVAESTGVNSKINSPRYIKMREAERVKFEKDPMSTIKDPATREYLKKRVVNGVPYNFDADIKDIEKEIVNTHFKNGNPRIRDTRNNIFSPIIGKDRPMYNPLTKTMHLREQKFKELEKKTGREFTGINDYAAELSHSKQHKETSTMSFLGELAMDGITGLAKKGSVYKHKNSLENKAHSKIEPVITKNLQNIQDKVLSDDYEKEVGLLTLKYGKQYKEGTMGIKTNGNKRDINGKKIKDNSKEREAKVNKALKEKGSVNPNDVVEAIKWSNSNRNPVERVASQKVKSKVELQKVEKPSIQPLTSGSYGNGTKGIKSTNPKVMPAQKGVPGIELVSLDPSMQGRSNDDLQKYKKQLTKQAKDATGTLKGKLSKRYDEVYEELADRDAHRNMNGKLTYKKGTKSIKMKKK
jgi:hypothetical protein